MPWESICTAESPLAEISTVRPSMVGTNELIVYRAKDLGVTAAVESGRGSAIVDEFITCVSGKRVPFIPFT